MEAQQINTGEAPTQFIDIFGASNTATYGQTFITPVGFSNITQFTFQLRESSYNGAAPAFDMRAYLAEWDGSKAGPLLFTSAVTAGPEGSGWTTYSFNLPNIALTAGQSYVAFLNVSDWISANPGQESYADMRSAVNGFGQSYVDGSFVYQNNASDFGSLFTNTWECTNDCLGDAAFTATFDTQVTPEPASLVLMGTGLVGIVMIRRRKRTA